ncbi:MAG TPA: hypothetical protein VLZ75_05390 [Chitinophagales bacterium]|nr:hypothetical protein [Chitinophagales bacterium]
MKNLFLLFVSSFLLSGYAFAQSAAPKNQKEEIDTYYYENSTIEFGEGVDIKNFKPIHPNSEFLLLKDSVKVFVILKLDKPLQTSSIIVDIYDEDEDPYDTFELDIEENWDFTSFSINFDKKGHYYLDIYTADDIFINSEELDIK